MRKLIVLILSLTITSPAYAQSRDTEWTSTETYVNEIKQDFNRCMKGYQDAGAAITNGVLLNCLPSGDDVRSVLAGNQPITSMDACVDWSLAFMGEIVSRDLINELNTKTVCRTEGIENVSLHTMLGWVVTSEIEPYGI